MNESQETAVVTAQLVSRADRMNALPRAFGPRHMLRAERLTYGWMQKLCKEYTGGYWNYYTLSNGGFYMALRVDGSLKLSHAENYFDGEMSTDAAGIVACLFAIGQLCQETESDVHVTLYHALLEYAREHPESSMIRKALD